MKNRKNNKRKNKSKIRKRQILKTAAAVFLVVIVTLLGISMCNSQTADDNEEVRGVWVSYVDFDKLGLSDKPEAEFRANAEAFYERAAELNINTVYFHVRVFRDATYKSDCFMINKNIWSRTEEIPYDPLEIMIELAEDHDMQLHAWLNPYRNYSSDMDIIDPGDPASTEEIIVCVNELIDKYDIAGIHFDDYFYPENSTVSSDEKKKNVNAMIQTVYKTVHAKDDDIVFGISPAGNIAYSESLGADIKTWLSQDGYIDYVVPQIYWTDEHTAQWRNRMFTDTLDEWISLNENGVPVYVGLALYKTGIGEADDPGWINRSDNIATQINLIRDSGCCGYSFFSAADLFRDSAEGELKNYQNLEF